MHQALYVEEILLHIFSYCCTLVYRRGGQQCWYANVHLVALASTCRAFKDPALNLIWAELGNLSPLVRCLPPESWGKSIPQQLYSFKKSLETTDWDIILGYARRVRALPRLHGSMGLTAECIKELSGPPASTESIFPGLRVVGILKPTTSIAPIVRHLINPNLTDISFEHVENLGASIDTLQDRSTILTKFCVSQGDPDAISGLICRWQNLRSVWCYNVGLNVDALSHLSRLHNLHHLAFKVDNAVVNRIHAAQASTSTLTLAALHDLRLTSSSLTSISRLFSGLHVPAIHGLTVDFLDPPTAPNLMSFFVALQEACTHNLLTDLSLCQSIDMPLENSSLYYITIDRLRPLTVFMNIRSIMLDIPCNMDLNERELLCLASSWPHLETFEVGVEYGWTESSAITPGGFVQLLEKCRSLRELYFMMDTRGYTEIPQGHP